MKQSKLTILIFIALFLGILTGWLFPDFAVKLHPLADIFLNMVKMIIAPLLFSTLVVGIAGHTDVKSLGRVGLKTLVYFEVVTLIALIIGLWVANVFKPGEGLQNFSNITSNLTVASQMAVQSHSNNLSGLLYSIFPTSIVKSMAEGNLLQIVVFSIFLATAICAVGKAGKPVLDLLNSVATIMFKFTEYVMMFAPIGVFGAIAHIVGSSGISVLSSYAKIIGCLYLALFLFVMLVLVVVCAIVKISFKSLLKAIIDPAFLAFTTASSEAALPKAMDIMENFGVPKRIVGFVMPTGYTFNLDGSTLYLSMAVLFSAQIVGIDLSLSQQMLIMFTLMFTSKGMAGVPRVSLIVLAGTLTGFNIPLLGIAVLLGIDQILDMGRTTVNLIGNCVATVVISRWEKCFDYEKMNRFINNGKQNDALTVAEDNTKEES